MKGITLLYDAALCAEVPEKIAPLFAQHLKISIVFENGWQDLLQEDDFVTVYLSDSQLKDFLSVALLHNWRIGVLPHPNLQQGRHRFGVLPSLEEGIRHMLEIEKWQKADVLLANDLPVFDTVVIGECLSVLWGSAEPTRIQRMFGRLKHFFKLFKQIKLHQYTLEFKETEDGKVQTIDTAALGMLVVLDGQSTLLSRKLIAGGSANDGMLHVLVVAPESTMGLLKFGFLSLFKGKSSSKLPPFVSYIKTSRLDFRSTETLEISVDDVLMSAKELVLEVKPKALRLAGAPAAVTVAKENYQHKVFKTHTLPRGELKNELLKGTLPFIAHATTEQFKELFSTLRENARPTSSYLVLMFLSTFIATLGLFSNSSPVIIGAMILAPLMSPIVSLSMGVLRQDGHLIRTSFKAIGLGLLLGYLCAMLVTALMPLSASNMQIITRTRPNLLDLGIAVGSGIAGAYAHARKEIAKTLAGVAIAVALVPPLAVSGIGAGRLNWELFSGALLLLITNLVGIVLAGAITFLFLGFSPFRRAKKGLVISLIFVLGISAPLAFSFTKMVRETRIVQSLDNMELEGIVVRDVGVRRLEPLQLSITVIAEKHPDEAQLRRVKQEIEKRLEEEVELEITMGVSL